jgi:phosphate transport system substrate-binding protein
MSTTGGIEGVLSGRLTLGLITRPLNDHEKAKLVYRVLARSLAIVTVNKALSVQSLMESQICDLFSGKSTSWKDFGGDDGKITVLVRKRDDSNTETFRDKMACFKNLKVTPDAIALTRGSEVLSAIDKRPGTVAITNMGSTFREHANLKALAINNVLPTPESARSDKYKFYHEHGIVTLGEPQGLTKHFLDFTFSPEGQKLLSTRGAIPLR